MGCSPATITCCDCVSRNLGPPGASHPTLAHGTAKHQKTIFSRLTCNSPTLRAPLNLYSTKTRRTRPPEVPLAGYLTYSDSASTSATYARDLLGSASRLSHSPGNVEELQVGYPPYPTLPSFLQCVASQWQSRPSYVALRVGPVGSLLLPCVACVANKKFESNHILPTAFRLHQGRSSGG